MRSYKNGATISAKANLFFAENKRILFEIVECIIIAVVDYAVDGS